MGIWRDPVETAALNKTVGGGLFQHLGMKLTEIGEDFLSGTMPVDKRTVQPLGLLHGGASVALAETLGSVAGTLCVREKGQQVVGMEINANHLRAVRSGVVTGTARPVHLGGRSQVWEIRIRDERERLVCISRITLAVLDAQG